MNFSKAKQVAEHFPGVCIQKEWAGLKGFKELVLNPGRELFT